MTTIDRIEKLGLACWSISMNQWVLSNDPITSFTFHCEDVIWECEEAKDTAVYLEKVFLFECRKVVRGGIIRLADPTYNGLLELVVSYFIKIH